MWGRAEGQVCANPGARTSIGASGIYYYYYYYYYNIVQGKSSCWIKIGLHTEIS